MSPKPKPTAPTPTQVAGAPEHVAWEYTALLAAALEITKAHRAPLNHEAQEVFLLHLRNLSDFFTQGVDEFRRNPGQLVPRNNDDIYAVDLCTTVGWNEAPFSKSTNLRQVVNSTLSHLTYSRDLTTGQSKIAIAFDAREHLHGTVLLVRRAWDDFKRSLAPEYRAPLAEWTSKHAAGLGVDESSFDATFESGVEQWQFRRNNTI